MILIVCLMFLINHVTYYSIGVTVAGVSLGVYVHKAASTAAALSLTESTILMGESLFGGLE